MSDVVVTIEMFPSRDAARGVGANVEVVTKRYGGEAAEIVPDAADEAVKRVLAATAVEPSADQG